MDPRHLYDHWLGPEPTKYVLKKILREEKSMCISPLFVFVFCLFFLLVSVLTSFLDPFLTGMATRYSKEKYVRVKGPKHEPLSQLAIDTKKC